MMAFTLRRRSLVGPLSVLVATLGLSAEAAAAQYFQEVTNAYGTQPCSPAGCWTNYTRLTDLDGDGDLDVVFPNADGFFSKGQAQPLVIYLNDGTGKFTDVSATIGGSYSGYLRQIAMGDVNGDGRPDMILPAAWGAADVLLMNQGGGQYVDEASSRLPGLHSNAGAVRFGDVDNDGDLDLFIGDSWTGGNPPAHLYLNDGTGIFTEAFTIPTSKTGSEPIDFDLLDADGDFDLDLLIDMHSGKSSLWINDGTGTYSDATGGFPAQSGLKYGPVACDVDGDGDLDIWFDNSGPGYTEQLLINDGAGNYTDETSQRVSNNPGSDDNGVSCVDVDGDGDFDAVVASLSDNERVLFNDGAGNFDFVTGAFPTKNDSTLWMDFGDVDGDGILDCITAQGESTTLNRLYVGIAPAPVDATPPAFRAIETLPASVSAEASPVLRFAVTDSATTDEGPRLQRAYVNLTTVDSAIEVDAVFSGGDMFRVAIPPAVGGSNATVTVTPCATDARGNTGCGPAQTYVVEGGAPATATTTTGQGPGAGGGSAQGVGGGNTTTASGESATGAGGDELVPTEGGCGCTLPGDGNEAPRGALLALGAAVFAAMSRKRR